MQLGLDDMKVNKKENLVEVEGLRTIFFDALHNKKDHLMFIGNHPKEMQ